MSEATTIQYERMSAKKTRTYRYTPFETFRAFHLEGEQPCLIFFDSKKFGTVIPISTHHIVVGRHDEDVITVGGSEDGVSRRHAEFERKENSTIVLRDLESNNGVFVDGIKIQEIELKGGEEILLGRIKLGFQYLSQSEIDSYQSIWIDPLTGALNRQCFNTHAQEIFNDYNKLGKNVSLVVFDIDNFKLINDNYGHTAGDDILSKLGSKVLSMLQEETLFFRYGGDEFVILILDYNHEDAFKYVLEVERYIEEKEYLHGHDHIKITISLGTSFIDEIQGEINLTSLLAIADSRLLIAKKAKHNLT